MSSFLSDCIRSLKWVYRYRRIRNPKQRQLPGKEAFDALLIERNLLDRGFQVRHFSIDAREGGLCQ